MSVYLDASVIVPLYVTEARTPAVLRRLRQEPEIFVSEFAAAEFASALSIGTRTGRISIPQAQAALVLFDRWRHTLTRAPRVEDADLRQAYLLVRRFDLELRAPDAFHIAVAQRLGATLVTVDRRMARAARVLGISVDDPK